MKTFFRFPLFILVGLLPILNACGQSQNKNTGKASQTSASAYTTFNRQMNEMNVAFKQDSSSFSEDTRQTFHKMQNLWSEMMAHHGQMMQNRGGMMGSGGRMMSGGMMGSRGKMMGNGAEPREMGKQMISYLGQMRHMMDRAGNPTMASMFGEMQVQFEKIQPGAGAISDSVSVSGNNTVSLANGKELFNRSCGTCHGANGSGLGGAFPPVNGSPIASGDKATVIKILLHGLEGPITVNGTQFNSMMPAYGNTYNDTQLAAILTYLRSMPKNRASRVTPDDIHKVREETASRSEPWTAKELGLK